MSRTARVEAQQVSAAEAAERGIRLWAGRGKPCQACGSDRMTWRIKVTADGEVWACECQQTWIEPAEYRVCLSLDSEEAGVVMDALMEHRRTNELRHAAAVARGDTVSTTDDRVAICVRVLEQLMRQTL